MSAENEVKASPRSRLGKGAARAARRAGLMPAIIYGAQKPPQPISLDAHALNKRIADGGFLTTVLRLNVDGKSERVIPRDVHYDAVRDFPMHVDFLRVAKDARIVVEVPVHFMNEDNSPGLKRGGVLNIVRHTVELNCPVDAIPDALEADVGALDLGDSVHISAVTLPEGTELAITDRDFTIVTVAASAGAKEELAQEQAEAEAEADFVPEDAPQDGETEDAGKDESPD